MNYNKKVSEYIADTNEEQNVILEAIRLLIHQNVENVTEEIKWRMPVFSKEKNFAYIRTAKKHITLGFYNTDKIIDPDNLLEGDGKTLKHIKIRTLEEINHKIISEWLKQITN